MARLCLIKISRHLRSGNSLLTCAALLACFLTGCTTASRSTSESFLLLVNKQAKASPIEVAANRFPQAQIRTPDLSALIVLGYVDGGRQTWYAADLAVFHLNSQGLLTGTTGLGRSIQARINGASPFDHLELLVSPVRIEREYDWIPSYRFGVPVSSTLYRAGTETIDILGRKMELARFEEELEGGGMDGRNIYWADPVTGFIWKSRQYLAPGYPVDLMQLKPYRQATD